ncbi:hypothetical protein ACFVJW_10730 [Streptomyces libani]|uniref:hypothetical protein n=1 Tax=Streptomyces nigrescens TaxID=1920 RepID=UPI003631E0E5
MCRTRAPRRDPRGPRRRRQRDRGAEYHNKKAYIEKKAYIGKKTYIEHDRRAGRAALNEEYDVRRRLRKALHYS